MFISFGSSVWRSIPEYVSELEEFDSISNRLQAESTKRTTGAEVGIHRLVLHGGGLELGPG